MVKKFSIAAIVLVLLAAAGAFLFQRQVGEWLFPRAVEQLVGRDTLAGLDDGLHVGLCGTGSPMPNLQRAGPCNVVIAGEQLFVIDIGEGGGRNINLMGFNPGDIDGVLLTHFHSDHIDGLGPLQLFHWTRGNATAPLPVYGPTGVEAVIDGFNAAYATDNVYRIAHHGEEVVPSTGGGSEARPFEMAADSVVVFERNGLKVTAFKVPHQPVEPAVGYRFDYKGRSACISGDTKKSANLERACQGVDVLVHEALQPAMITVMQGQFEKIGAATTAKVMHDIKDYHASPEEAAESAQAAGARMLVLSHLVPALPTSYLYPAFLRDAPERFDGELVIGEDGMFFSLLPDSETIERNDLM